MKTTYSQLRRMIKEEIRLQLLSEVWVPLLPVAILAGFAALGYDQVESEKIYALLDDDAKSALEWLSKLQDDGVLNTALAAAINTVT